MTQDTSGKPVLRDTPQSLAMSPGTKERLLLSLDMNPDTREKPVPTDTLQNLHPPDTSVAQSAGDKEGPGVGG